MNACSNVTPEPSAVVVSFLSVGLAFTLRYNTTVSESVVPLYNSSMCQAISGFFQGVGYGHTAQHHVRCSVVVYVTVTKYV